MAFPDDYSDYQVVTIDSDQVSGTSHTDFPVLIDLADFAGFTGGLFDTCLSSGGDIRVTLSDGTTQLAREIVSIDTTGETGEMWVCIPTLSGSVDTDIWVWYNGVDTEPAADSTYGSEAVWNSNYKAVYHMAQDPSGSAPQMLDSTSNDNHGTSVGSMVSGDLVDAQIGKGLFLDTTPQRISASDSTSLDITGALTVQCWCDREVYFFPGGIVSKYYGSDQGSYSLFASSDCYPGFCVTSDGGNGGYKEVIGSTNLYLGTNLKKVTGVFVPSTSLTVYCNGAQDAQETSGVPASIYNSTAEFWIGADYESSIFYGLIDEVRVIAEAISSDWEATEYANQNSPTTFYSVASPSSTVDCIASMLGYIPELTLTAEFNEERINMSGIFPVPILSTDFDERIAVSGRLPVPVLTTTYGARASEMVIPVPELSGSVARNETASLFGIVPTPVLATRFASRAEAMKLPIPHISVAVSRNETLEMSGKIPVPVLRSIIESNIIRMSGKLPDIRMQSLIDIVCMCGVSGVIPPPIMQAVCELIVMCSMSGVLPVPVLTATTAIREIYASGIIPPPIMQPIASGDISGIGASMSEHSRFDGTLLRYDRWSIER